MFDILWKLHYLSVLSPSGDWHFPTSASIYELNLVSKAPILFFRIHLLKVRFHLNAGNQATRAITTLISGYRDDGARRLSVYRIDCTTIRDVTTPTGIQFWYFTFQDHLAFGWCSKCVLLRCFALLLPKTSNFHW